MIDEVWETSKSPRHKLIGKHYFCDSYKGQEANRRLWEEVRDYIDTHYDTEYLKCAYIAGDDAGWIRTGCEVLGEGKFVLDKFHMMKYVNVSVSHLLDGAEEVKEEIWECLNGRYKKRLQKVYTEILKVTEEGRKNHRAPSISEGRRKENRLTEEEPEIKKNVSEKQAGWRYQERLQGWVPGLEQSSLKWMRVWINQELGA